MDKPQDRQETAAPVLQPDTNRLFMTRLLQFLQENNPQLKDRLLEKQQVISQPPVSGNVMGFLTPYQAGKLGAMNTALRGSYAQSQPGMKQLDTATWGKKKDRVSFLRNLGKFKDTLQVITLANARLTAEQVEALASALPALTNLTHLDLSNNPPTGEQGAVALANALRQLPQLKHLDLDGISLSPQGQGVSALADALPALTQLTYLSLGHNKIGDPGITALANSIKTLTNLRELHLPNMNIGNSTLIIGGLLGALRNMTQLKHLDMSSNPLGTNALHGLLSHIPNLQVLALAGTHLGDQGVGTLVHHHLGRLTKLTHLNLSNNNIGDQGASALAGVLPSFTNLKKLILDTNNIGDSGASALAGVLPNLTQLTDLDLRNNNIADQGAIALAGALRHLTHLKKLDLRKNKFGDRGAIAWAGVLPSLTKLQNLSLMEGNSIGAPGALAMARSFSRLSNFS